MKVFLRGLNACVMRNQKLLQYTRFLEANSHEIVEMPGTADAIILWTCAFRADHRDASIATVERMLREYPAIVVVAGCLPPIAGDRIHGNGRLVTAGWNNDIECMDSIFKSSFIS